MNPKKPFKDYQEAITFLDSLGNEKRALFSQKMINSPKLKFHGLDTKTMRQVMKDWTLLEGPLDYSYELTSLIFASNVENLQDDKALIKYLLEFIQQVDNWAHIDSIDSYNKVKKLPYELFFPLIEHTRHSEMEFVSRFYYVSFIRYKARVELYDSFLASILDSDKYYTRMAIAWVLAEMFTQDDDKILTYLRTSSLSKTTKLKAIQKIKESRKTTAEQLEKLEALRAEIKK
jgi:3-methyladenine DNA glycosylase AlkD